MMINRQILLILSKVMVNFHVTATGQSGTMRYMTLKKEIFSLLLKRATIALQPLLLTAILLIVFSPLAAQEAKGAPAKNVQLKKINISNGNKNGDYNILMVFANSTSQPSTVHAELVIVDERDPLRVLFREKRTKRLVPGDSLQNGVRINFHPKQPGYFKSI
ncbi:MAG TPA: hypothetical protein VEY06_07840, partial [Flavisolibacter sp.]|nr:hypothetical protein [Flavisolibacter sp.]